MTGYSLLLGSVTTPMGGVTEESRRNFCEIHPKLKTFTVRSTFSMLEHLLHLSKKYTDVADDCGVFVKFIFNWETFNDVNN